MKRDDDSTPFDYKGYEEGLSQLADDLVDKESRSADKSMLPFHPYESDPETLARLDALIRPDLNDQQFKEHLERVYAIRRKDPAVRGPAMTAIGSLGYFGGLPARGLMMPGGGFRRGEFISHNAFVAPELRVGRISYEETAFDLEATIQKQYGHLKLHIKQSPFAKEMPPIFTMNHYKQKLDGSGGYEKQKPFTTHFTNKPRFLTNPYLYETSTRIVDHTKESPYAQVWGHELWVAGFVVKDWKRFPDYQALK